MLYGLVDNITEEVYELLIKVDPRLFCFKQLIDQCLSGRFFTKIELEFCISGLKNPRDTFECLIESAFNLGLLQKLYTEEEYIVLSQNPWKGSIQTPPYIYSFQETKFFEKIEIEREGLLQIGKVLKYYQGDELSLFIHLVDSVLEQFGFNDEWFFVYSKPRICRPCGYMMVSPAVQWLAIHSRFKEVFPNTIIFTYLRTLKTERNRESESYLKRVIGFTQFLNAHIEKLPQEAQAFIKLSGITF